MRLDLTKLTTQSAFDLATNQAHRLEKSNFALPEQPDFFCVELADILHLPSAWGRGEGLCLYQSNIIPMETYVDDYVFELINKPLEDIWFNKRYTSEFDVSVDDRLVCIVANFLSATFGHWTEEILKVIIFENRGVKPHYVISHLPKFAAEFLKILGVPEERMIDAEGPTLYRRTLFATGLSHQNVDSYSYALMELRAKMDERFGGRAPGGGGRYWLERRHVSSAFGQSGTANKEEVYKLIGRYGFNVVDMSEYSIEEQISIARSADILAGPHGSQFVHAQFQRYGGCLIECFSPVYVNPSIFKIVKVLDLEYHQITARSHVLWPYTIGRECNVDIELLEIILNKFTN